MKILQLGSQSGFMGRSLELTEEWQANKGRLEEVRQRLMPFVEAL